MRKNKLIRLIICLVPFALGSCSPNGLSIDGTSIGQSSSLETEESTSRSTDDYSEKVSETPLLTSSNLVHAHEFVIDEPVNPSCTEEGLTAGLHCGVCQEVLISQKPVAALGHQKVVDEAVAPSFDHDGLTEGSHCKVCGEIFLAQSVIPSLRYVDYAYWAQFAYDQNCVGLQITKSKKSNAETYDGICYSRDGDNGELLKDGNGQINFTVDIKKGYEVKKISIVGGYKNLKNLGKGQWRITKISSNLMISIEVGVSLSSSLESGFYDAGTELTFSSESGTIYYTLDGTTPNIRSREYKGPIILQDASSNPNVFSNLTTTSGAFLKDLLANVGSTAPDYSAPNELIDKCVVIKAIAIDENGMTSKVCTRSFFVGFENKEGYENTNIVSIVSEPNDLFSYDNGIYVMGRTFDEIDINDYWFTKYWWWWPGNYSNKGEKWEIKANMSFFDQEGSLLLEKDGGIRIHGGGTRGYPQKSFNLYARDKYDGQSVFDYPFFGNDYLPQRMTLSMGGDDNFAKICDYFASEFIPGLHLSVAKMVRYCLFLNGEFWGYYYLSEKYDEEYFSHYYSVDKDNVLYLKNGGIEEGEESDWALYEEFYDRVNNHDLAVEENFRKALEIIDFDSLVDYYAFMIYIQRYADWSPISSNYGFWRSKSIGDKMEDGKWRWVIFDVNSGTFNDSSEDSISRIATDDYIFKHFYANHTFVEALKGRLEFLRDEIFDLSAVNAFLDNFKATYKAQAVKEDIRFFGGSGDGVTFYNNKIESVRSFMNARPQYINDFLQS